MVCYNCFREKSSYGPCPFCGYDPTGAEEKYPLALKPGSILNGRYTVGRVIGQGGFGITYIAQDYQTKERVAIKEYFPSEFAGRSGSDSSIQVHSKDQKENFEYGKNQFLQEAKTLAAFIGDEHIVRIYSYFEENNTAYFVMEYVDGYSLDKYMAQKGGRLNVNEANRLLLPLMKSLDKVHAKGIIHRDIAPDNIIITKDGTAKLIDFGAARYSTGEKSKSLDVILKHGFAPAEQYMRRGKQGPYTDVYALAATYYYAITGKVLPDAVERMQDDTMFLPSALGVKISADQEDVLLKALEVSYNERYHSMREFYQDMASSGRFAPDTVNRQTAFNKESNRVSSTTARTEQEAKERAERLERELREAKEEAARLEQERKEREAREEAARREQERREREAREEAARLERERKEREAKEAEERRKKELAEKKAREEAERQEKLRLEREKRDEEKRLAAEKKKQEAAEKERLRQEAVARRKAEQERQLLKVEQKKTETRKKSILPIIVAVFVLAVAIGYFVAAGTKRPSAEVPVPQETVQPTETGLPQETMQQPTSVEEASPSEAPVEEAEPSQPKTPEEQAEPFVTETPVEESVEPAPTAAPVEEAEPVKTPADFYAEGITLQTSGDWNAAIEAFTQAGDYQDAAEQILATYYAQGLALKDAKEWSNAKAAFELAGGYKDSQDQIQIIQLIQEIARAEVGDSFFFGTYEQDSIYENGKEPIEWLVLFREDDRIVAISKYLLDSQPYNTEYASVTWESCSIRKWLNDTFLKEAFNKDEQSLIMETQVQVKPAGKMGQSISDPGNDTLDQVFLLSWKEYGDSGLSMEYVNANKGGGGNKPTPYAIDQGCVPNTNGSCHWWLRTAGDFGNYKALISQGSDADVSSRGIGVRPAICFDLTELSDSTLEQSEIGKDTFPFSNSIQTAGSIVTFGSYEQDNDLTNGKEPIEWIVLDVQDGKSLLISKYGLDCQPYNYPQKEVYWETCGLRTWLNQTFLEEAFTDEEKGKIPTVTVKADMNPSQPLIKQGNDISDQIFLLSIPEASQYFASDFDRQCIPTEFAKANGCGEPFSWWWLRTMGPSYNKAAIIDEQGSVVWKPVEYNGKKYIASAGTSFSDPKYGGAVRPAMWIDTSELFELPPEQAKEIVEFESTKDQSDLQTVGSIVTFGSYEQDNDLTNGKEPIEWIILDVQDGKSLLISKYGLEPVTSINCSAWKDSIIRDFLNIDFYADSFSEQEKDAIQITFNQNGPDASYPKGFGNGESTEDRIFLLSYDEVVHYFPEDKRGCLPTKYVIATGREMEANENALWARSDNCMWATRTQGEVFNSPPNYTLVVITPEGGNYAYYVYSGRVDNNYPERSSYMLRPAIWVDADILAESSNSSMKTINQSDPSRIGSIITLGSYEQDGNNENGLEPIEWIVIEVENEKSLLLSRYGLTALPYNNKNGNVTWETSTIREWLNKTFLQDAFNETEQYAIELTGVDNSNAQQNKMYYTNGGNNTQDRIFLLSHSEIEEYLQDEYYYDTCLKRRCKPTSSVQVEYNPWLYYDPKPWCWLRSPGDTQTKVEYIDDFGMFGSDKPGSIRGWNATDSAILVRPAMWIDTSKLLDLPYEQEEDTQKSESLHENGDLQTVGSIITFGHYEQDNNLSNGKESIEWIVLDALDGKSLLLSKYGLDCQPYNANKSPVTWETSSIREWLNSSFLNEAFSTEEQAKIQLDFVNADKNPGYDTTAGNGTTDQLFLLSILEAEQYLSAEDERKCSSTEYAKAQGCYTSDPGSFCWWWLRSPGFNTYTAVHVNRDGSILLSGDGVDYNNVAVRPAIWVNWE